MMKSSLALAALIAGYASVQAQSLVPKNKEGATPAPPALKSAPPEKIAPGPLNSPNAVSPDSKAETSAPPLKMDPSVEKKSPSTTGQRGDPNARRP